MGLFSSIMLSESRHIWTSQSSLLYWFASWALLCVYLQSFLHLLNSRNVLFLSAIRFFVVNHLFQWSIRVSMSRTVHVCVTRDTHFSKCRDEFLEICLMRYVYVCVNRYGSMYTHVRLPKKTHNTHTYTHTRIDGGEWGWRESENARYGGTRYFVIYRWHICTYTSAFFYLYGVHIWLRRGRGGSQTEIRSGRQESRAEKGAWRWKRGRKITH